VSYYAEQYDSQFRWAVRSRSEGKHVYVADIKKWECQCKDFTIRHRKAVVEGGDKEAHSCFHLRCATETWWDTHVEPVLGDIPVVRHLPAEFIKKNKLRLALALLADIPEHSE